jgi:uncharacterized lipoprotein YajG
VEGDFIFVLRVNAIYHNEEESMRRHKGILVLIILLSGCTFIDQTVKFNPQLNLQAVDIGKGKKIALDVLDDREDSTIGKRGTGMVRGAKISTDEDVVGIFQTAITDGLQKYGFVLAPNSEDVPTKLRVEIRNLNYDVTMGLWTGGNIGKASLKVTAFNGSTYEKMYRGEKEIRTAFVASQETNSKIINAAVSQVLEEMFSDKELLVFLSK